MRRDGFDVEPRTRRHVMRLSGLLGASVVLGVLASKSAEAAGRHSDPFFCEPACLLRGSFVETDRGEVAVERLRVGDAIKTIDGSFSEVTWIGRQLIRRPRCAVWSYSVDPVLVVASAIAPGSPLRDVYISPMHALYIDDYLIPSIYLVNGASVRQSAWNADVIEYFHVECARHEVMLANGLPVETYRFDEANPECFDNHETRQRASKHSAPYAPVLGYWSARSEALGLIRSIASHVLDVRDPIQVAYDRIAARALEIYDLDE